MWSPHLTTRSGKPTMSCANEPLSASIRLGETIFWSRAALRFSFGSWSHDTISGTDISAGMVEVMEQRKKQEKKC